MVPSFEEIDDLVALPSVSGGTEITNIVNMRLVGHRIGNTYFLGINFGFDMTTGNNFDQVTINTSSFSFLSGKTLSRVHGSTWTNINDSISPGKSAPIGIDCALGTSFRLNFTGQFQNVNTRAAHGTLVVVVN